MRIWREMQLHIRCIFCSIDAITPNTCAVYNNHANENFSNKCTEQK